MIEMINGKAYVKKGDKVYEVGGGGTNFIFANSKDELPDPSTVPENSVGLVPSEESAGGGGLPVVELTTLPTAEGSALTADENVMMNAIHEKGGIFILRLTFMDTSIETITAKTYLEGNPVFCFAFQGTDFHIAYISDLGGWMFFFIAEME